MTATERTSHRKPSGRAAIQHLILTGSRHSSRLKVLPRDLTQAANRVLTSSQQKAFQQGIFDHDNSTRDHSPYGFSDLKQAWLAGRLFAEQKKNESLNSGRRASLDGKSA